MRAHQKKHYTYWFFPLLSELQIYNFYFVYFPGKTPEFVFLRTWNIQRQAAVFFEVAEELVILSWISLYYIELEKKYCDNHEVLPDSFYDTFEIHSTIDVARGGVCVEDFFLCWERCYKSIP